MGICVCLPVGALRRARVRSGCAVSDRNHRGSRTKQRGRTHTRRIHTGGRLRREREREEEEERYTPADGGAQPKKRHYSVKRKGGIAFPSSFSRLRISGAGKRRTGVLIDMDLFIYLSIDFALIG